MRSSSFFSKNLLSVVRPVTWLSRLSSLWPRRLSVCGVGTPVTALALGLVVGTLVPSSNAYASNDEAGDDIAAACEEAARLWRDDQDVVGALEEATWCLEGLRQLKQDRALSMFPDEVDGFVGGDVSSQKALGMSMIERKYTRDGKTINVSLTGGGGSGGAAAGLAGLAALAEMGMSLGAQSGTKFRVQRRTVLDTSEATKSNFMVQLRSGGMLTLSSTSVDHDTAMAFVKAFPIGDLDDALKD